MANDRYSYPHTSNLSFHNVRYVSVQKDREHNCIDIVLSGSNNAIRTRISVWDDVNNMPTFEVLPDAVPADEEDEETDA